MSDMTDDDLLRHTDPQAEAKKFKSEQAQQLAAHVKRTQEAYKRVFKDGDPDVELVLADLQAFARFNTSTFHENERIHVLLSGRYEMCRRISDYTTLPLGTLQNMVIKEG